MKTMREITNAHARPQLSFENLRGLRAEGYIRDSTLDQRDGFGPDIQRTNIQRFAESYGLMLGDRWYTEFVSGRSASKRALFQKFIEDAGVDTFDVLLVDHTSRFGRNQEECIRYKSQLQELGKVVVFVAQGIISGSDRDFINERINETLDEAYSRNLSRYIAAGLAEKANHGIANGKPPLGYRSEKLDSGKRERKVPDRDGIDGDSRKGGMGALMALLQSYASGQYSYRTLADHLNAQGYRNRLGKPFTDGSVEHVLVNRFYEGKAVYHPGMPDEVVREGDHDVPPETKALWLKCQQVKNERSRPGKCSPRQDHRVYPFTGVLVCDECGKPYHGETVQHSQGREYRRMYHQRRRCQVKPLSINADRLKSTFGEDVLAHIRLDDGWREAILKAVANESPQPDNALEIRRTEAAITNLRKQHMWGAIADSEFGQEFQQLDRQKKVLQKKQESRLVHTPNLDRSAELLKDLPALWAHPGVDDRQRRELVREAFEEVVLRGHDLISVTPKPQYAPLFAYVLWKQQEFMSGVGVTGLEPATSTSRTWRPTNWATPRHFRRSYDFKRDLISIPLKGSLSIASIPESYFEVPILIGQDQDT